MPTVYTSNRSYGRILRTEEPLEGSRLCRTSRSIPASLLDVQADDQILLLVTCLDGDDERFVVAARRLRENETADSLDFRKQ